MSNRKDGEDVLDVLLQATENPRAVTSPVELPDKPAAPSPTDLPALDLPIRDEAELPRAAPSVGPGPRCMLCGSTSVRPSSRGGFRAVVLSLAGAALYRCDACHRRFAFAPLGRQRGRRTRHSSGAVGDVRPEIIAQDGRRRAIAVLTIVLAAIVTYLVASWLINRAEEQRLNDSIVAPPPS